MIYNFGVGKQRLNFIDLFSGCGGFSYGLEMAGHRCLLGVDFCPDAIKTFAHNHPYAETFCGDIRKLTAAKLKKLVDPRDVDMVIGGPPCQGFSTVGKGILEDERNWLFREFVRVVKLVNPKVIVMENVTGLLAKKNAPAVQSIFKLFERQGYRLDAKVLSAEEYGVPQVRRRTIIIGSKGDVFPMFPAVTHGLHGRLPTASVKDAFSNLAGVNGKKLNHDTKSAAIKNDLDKKRLARVPEGGGIRYQKDEMDFLPPRLRLGIDWQKTPENRLRQTKYRRLNTKLPAPTILTSRTSYYHPTKNRYLTVREAAACQSFPPNFEFFGSLTSQFRQIGNAVPPVLGKAIGLAVKKMLSARKPRRPSKARRPYLSQDFGHAFNYK